MQRNSEVQGVEFDWFARDRSGHLALFATAGSGPCPASVNSSMEVHSHLANTIDVSDLGTTDVWQSYSKVGLFVYDWSETQGCYVLVATPASSASKELSAAILSIPDLYQFDLSFAETETLIQSW
jgi:hypothetical protein